MTFIEWITKYWNNPAPITQQAKETGLTVERISAWGRWLQNAAQEYFAANNSFMTLEQVTAEWTRTHPATVKRQTPFGVIEVPIDPVTGTAARYVGELTIPEFEAMLVKHCGK